MKGPQIKQPLHPGSHWKYFFLVWFLSLSFFVHILQIESLFLAFRASNRVLSERRPTRLGGRSRACACVVSNSFDLYILLELAPGFDLASFPKNVTESRTFFPKPTVSWLPLKVTNATASQFLLRNSRTLLYTIVSLCLPQNSATCYYILSFNFCGPLMQKDETKLKLFFWASNVLFV